MLYNIISLSIIFSLFAVIAIKRNKKKLDMVEDFLWMVVVFALIRLTAYTILGV